jgi:nicotinate-nucleotide adenylyltransferase
MIGLIGGTFDPIHFGHLRMAQELQDILGLQQVRFIPSASPPHKRTTAASATHRAEMVRLAIADNPAFSLDLCELERAGPSYTIDTLLSLRKALGDQIPLCLCMGSDAFMQLHTWHRWQELLDHCHIILVQRPNHRQLTLSEILQQLLQDHYTEHIDDLRQKSNGHISMQAITALDISATAIRESYRQGHSLRYLMPEAVIAYILANGLYQP